MEKCRICLRCRKNLLSIYAKADDITYADMISSIANVKIRIEDGFSDKICRTCRGKLIATYNFKIEIERAENILQETSNLKRINFSNLRDIQINIEIDTCNYDNCKPLAPVKEILSEKLFKKGLNSLSYNNTIIKKIEQPSEIEDKQKKKPLSVGEFLNSIKTESDNDCDYQDYELDADDYNFDSGINYSYDKKKCKKNTKPKKKRKQTGRVSSQPLLSKPIKPKYIDDLRLARTEVTVDKKPKKPRYPSKTNVCPYCGKLFQYLNNHLLVHTAEKKFKCDQCPKAFFRESSLKWHMKRHSDIKNYKCDQCIAAFHIKAALQAHMLIHCEEKKYVCEICNKAFKRKPILKRHMFIHMFGPKPVKCDICPMTFTTQYHLRHHMRVHTGERPFKCEICSQPYSYKNDFNRHCLKKHGVFLKRRSVHVLNEEVLEQEQALMRDLSLRAHGILKLGELKNPFEGPQGALAYQQAMKAIESNHIPIIF